MNRVSTVFIEIERLYPGEAALSGPRVAQLREQLQAGGSIEPVNVCSIEGLLVVRNGNNRVRALVEHHIASGAGALLVPCLLGDAPAANTASRDGIRRFALNYGCGIGAFKAMPLSGANDYEQLQTQTAREIFSRQ